MSPLVPPTLDRSLTFGLALAALGLGLAGVVVGPIPQDPAYHAFADRRVLLGIPYFWNVVSNAPFLLVGALGLAFLARTGARRARALAGPGAAAPFAVFFAGVGLTGLGSAYYHAYPTNLTLVWDRLPMTAAFMALVAAVLEERVDPGWGRRLLWPLVALGAASVLYWDWGERRGVGDLRLYVLVQFGPLVAIPALLAARPARYTRGGDWIGALAWYAGAKVLEHLDGPVFGLGGVVSGHTLKHLASATGAYWILRMLRRRRPVG